MATSAGSGFSALADTALTGWEGPGPTGLRFYVRDLDSGEFWAPGRPSSGGGAPSRTGGNPGVFTLETTSNDVRTTVETCVLVDRTAELRRVTLTDLSGDERCLDITSLAEIVLNGRASHASHPAFSKLFLQTEFVADKRALLVRRRPREPREQHPTLIHAVLEDGPVEFESDRTRFLGRGRPHGIPAAMTTPDPLSGTVGNVLDPVVSLRRKLTVPADGSVAVTYLFGAADDTAAALGMLEGWDESNAVEQAFEAARGAGADRLARLGLTENDHVHAQHLAAAVLSNDPALRANTAVLDRAEGSPDDLARLGIDPHLPLAVVSADATLTESMILIHRAWHSMHLSIQLVVLAKNESDIEPSPGLVQLQPADLTSRELDLLMAEARLVVIVSLPELASLIPPPTWAQVPAAAPHSVSPPQDLRFFNGHGGFNAEGTEYVIDIPSDKDGALLLPPQPWTNVLANDRLGCILSETGAGATWYGNSREHRITPWFNDPLLDPHGDALYLRDESAGSFFSCLPGPVPAGGHYEMRHGQGHSRCRRRGNDLETETVVFVDRHEPVRLTRVRVTNHGSSSRRLSLFSCSQLVLGVLPGESSRHVVTSFDEATGAMHAHNRTAGPFAGHVAFATMVGDEHLKASHFSGDRTRFLGPALDFRAPAAFDSLPLDGKVGSGLDPCFALQADLTVDPGETSETWVMLGQAEDVEEARTLVGTLQQVGACQTAWHTTGDSWRHDLDGVKVRTPSESLDLMVNGWLGYQTLACRMQGRSALYQSGGAYGFRDQLQDSLALIPYLPDLTRRQILLHAAHQFAEGDVLHWWHPPLSRGIRTRFADDLLWLPLATVEYMAATGDEGLLAEQVPFLTARNLEPGQDEVFLQPRPSGESADLYEHCCRAIDRSLTRGAHGLPLFGTGDWNDGMNRVGREGRGESVWMGFFLVKIIDGFLSLCMARGDRDRALRYRRYRKDLVHTLNDTGWDGGWYRRGYYDDGSPLGSWENKECAIDALAQAWSVLSGVASPARAEQVMDAVEEHLINDEDRLIRLLTPPFVDTPHDPGYIKGYVAGVRENGGQYTHAALWVVRAMAKLGRRNRAAQLLDLLNPVSHSSTPEKVARYQVEPYVVAADVYGAPPHVGRGGWTWYTGSSGWALRVALESILGLQAAGPVLVVAPCIPDEWPEYTITWRVPSLAGDDGARPDTVYEIHVTNPDRCSESVVKITLDGTGFPPVDGTANVPLLRDGSTHELAIVLGPRMEVGP